MSAPPASRARADADFTVVAIISAFNEGDVIEHVVKDLIEQEVGVYFLDDGSTDDTWTIVNQYVGRGVIGVERLADTIGQRTATDFQWERILHRKAQLAGELRADWFIHHDADEFRESPWPQYSLREAIRRVDALGYSAIDFAVVDFWPVDDLFRPGTDVREALTFFAPSASYDRLQVRAWKAQPRVDLASTGGHDVRFPNRNVFPLRFILRHYPIRGQAHGERKVFHERRGRFLDEERARGWHIQYDEMIEGGSFIRDPSTLTPYDGDALRLEVLLHHRGVEELQAEAARLREEADTRASALLRAQDESTHAASDLRALTLESVRLSRVLERRERELDTLSQDMLRLQQLADRQQHDLADLRAELHGRIAEAGGLRLDVDAQTEELRRLRSELEHRTREVQALHHSMSWRVTRPLRAVYSLLTCTGPASSSANTDAQQLSAQVQWGDLARMSPVSAFWGTDRGLPVDRYYIEQFLSAHGGDIHGRVLEMRDPHYANTFGSNLLKVDVLDIVATNERATLIADLSRADPIPGNQFDCFILTQTLHIIYDVEGALSHAVRLLKAGGTLLCTIPAVSRVNYEDGGLACGDYWRLTRAAVEHLFGEQPELERVSVETFGNVRVCTAFLYGLATEDLDAKTLQFNDPWFPLVHCVRAVKRLPGEGAALKGGDRDDGD